MVDPITASAAAAGVKAAGQAVGGLVKFGASLFGGGKRRREQRRAAKELAQEKAKFEQLDTSNPYKNITNPYENLTVNTQAADFAAQQSAQGAANIMSSMAASAGGGGIAALAQSMANSQNQQAQQAAASIAQQESRNQVMAAQGENSRQMAIAGGEAQSQRMAYEKQSTLLGMAQQRKAAADQARKDATNQMVSGLTDIAGGVAGAKASGAGDILGIKI
tara:strand:+ start:95 stop:754 length:660 start_codon:yes stop_codon:yes gene_type:complete